MPEPSISPLSMFFLFGVVQAIFLSVALLTANKGNRQANKYLAAMLLAFGIILFNEFLDQSLYGLDLMKFMIVCFPIDFLLGPLIWLYELSLPKLASNLSVSPNNLSQVINERFSMNFFDYINSYRIEEAKHQLINSDLGRVTIPGVALDSGFNSKSAFYTGRKKNYCRSW